MRIDMPVRFWPVSDMRGTRIDVEFGRLDLFPGNDRHDRLRMSNHVWNDVMVLVRGPGPQFKAFWSQVERSDFV